MSSRFHVWVSMHFWRQQARFLHQNSYIYSVANIEMGDFLFTFFCFAFTETWKEQKLLCGRIAQSCCLQTWKFLSREQSYKNLQSMNLFLLASVKSFTTRSKQTAIERSEGIMRCLICKVLALVPLFFAAISGPHLAEALLPIADQKESFGKLIACMTGYTGRSRWVIAGLALKYNEYGCFCGLGRKAGANSSFAVDSIDECCRLHDLCWQHWEERYKLLLYR